MSDTYTKLFRSIVASTIVSEPVSTRWLWVTMMSQTDAGGCVYGSIPGLARLANITLEECEAGLNCFLSPDPYSRTQDHEGRRIEEIDGGWRLLNHLKYDEHRSKIDRAEAKREWDRQNRPSGHRREKQSDDSPTQSDAVRQSPTRSDETRQSVPIALALSLSLTEEEKAKETREDTCGVSATTKRKRAPAQKLTFSQWEKTIDEQQDEIPEHHWSLSYAAQAGIPQDFVYLAFLVFADMHRTRDDKRQKDWPATFGNYLRGNYLKLWYVTDDGGYALTSAGKQARKAHEQEAA